MTNIILLCVLAFLGGVVFVFIGLALLIFWSYDDA
jgi:hypothetical protein